MLRFLINKSYFTDDQFAFLTNRSTSTQMLVMLNYLYEAIQENKSIDVIYIEVQCVYTPTFFPFIFLSKNGQNCQSKND